MKKTKKGFIAIILFFLIIAIAVAVMPIIMQTSSYFAISETERALFSAESGIRYFIKNKLEPENDWTTIGHVDRIINQTFGDGVFTVGPSDDAGDSAQTTQGRIILKSTGYVTVGANTFSRTIKYKVARGKDMWENSIYSGGHCKGTTAEPCCDVDDAACEADDECCEGDTTLEFIVNGIIDGDIAVTGSFNTGHNNNLEINGEVEEDYPGPVITIDWPYWQSNADTVITPPTGTHTFDTDINGIFYVDGDVIVDSNITVNGTIIVTGDFDIDNGNTIAFYPDAGRPSVASGGNINIRAGNSIISGGAIYAADNIFLDQSNNLQIDGTLMAGNDIITDHTNNIVFNEPGEDEIITEGFLVSGGSFAARYSMEEYQEADDFN